MLRQKNKPRLLPFNFNFGFCTNLFYPMHKTRHLLPLLLLFLFLSGNRLFAQPVYESDDFAELDDSFLVSRISILDIPGFDYTLAGADTTWNFSAFVPVSQEYQRFVDPDRTGFRGSYILSCNALCYTECYNDCVGNGQFPFICSGYCSVDCGSTCLTNWITKFDLAKLSTDSINLVIATLEDVYNFYDISQTALNQVALGAKLQGFPIIVDYDNPDRVHVFPMHYGDTDSSFSNFAVKIDSIPGTGIPVGLNYRHGQKRYNNIEGWGTLITPYGVFDSVLKVRSEVFNEDTVIFQNDTFTLKEFLPAQVLPERVIEYKWYSPDFGIPLLEVSAWVVDGNLIYQDLKYIDSLRCFEPLALFGYLPLPAILDGNDDSIEVNFYSLALNGDSLYWNFDDDFSTNNTTVGANPTHYFSEGGLYNVQFVACNRACPDYICDTFSLPVLVIDLREPEDTTSIALLADGSRLLFYPNPFHDRVVAEITNTSGRAITLHLRDLAGRKLLTLYDEKTDTGSRTLSWNLSQLPAGMYVVEINYGTSASFCKLIKQQR